MARRIFPSERRSWLLRYLTVPLLLLGALLALAATLSSLATATAPRHLPSTATNLAQAFAAEYGVTLPHIAASAAYIFDADTGAMLFERNPDSSSMGLSKGEQLTLGDLLYGLLLPSANDASVAIADGVGGSEAQFVALMNQEAQQLGLTHTHFANPHGLDADGHHTTARELAKLAALALRNPIIARIAATHHYAIPKTATHKAFDLVNYNSILPGGRTPYPGAIGLKPGNTGDAGWCEAFAARRYGHLVIGVVLNDPTWSRRNDDMHTLLDWAFVQLGVPPAG